VTLERNKKLLEAPAISPYSDPRFLDPVESH